jgi:hypothetical protein
MGQESSVEKALYNAIDTIIAFRTCLSDVNPYSLIHPLSFRPRIPQPPDKIPTSPNLTTSRLNCSFHLGSR